jgi:hypothetical protein
MAASKKQPKDHDSTKKPVVKECKSRANDLLKYAGTWEGDDLEECLAEVYKTRGETVF